MFIRRLTVVLVLLTTCLSGATLAATGDTMDLEKIRKQQAQIRAELQAEHGRYASMPASKRQELLVKQSDLLELIEGKEADHQLSNDEKLQAFNTLEWIEAAINDAEDERVICTRERPTGSNRVQSVCKTVAQRREEREYSERTMKDRRAVCSDGNLCAGK